MVRFVPRVGSQEQCAHIVKKNNQREAAASHAYKAKWTRPRTINAVGATAFSSEQKKHQMKKCFGAFATLGCPQEQLLLDCLQ